MAIKAIYWLSSGASESSTRSARSRSSQLRMFPQRPRDIQVSMYEPFLEIRQVHCFWRRGEGGISSKRMVGISLRDQPILSSLERSSKTASVFRSHADISMTHPSRGSAEPSPQIPRLHTQYLYYVQPTESSLHIVAFTIL